MVDFSAIATSAWFVLLLSIVISLVIFPLVVLGSFVYDWLVKKYEKTPKVLIMLFVTLLCTLLAVAVIELYLGNQLAAALTA